MWTYRVFPSRIARTAVPTMSRFELALLLAYSTGKSAHSLSNSPVAFRNVAK